VASFELSDNNETVWFSILPIGQRKKKKEKGKEKINYCGTL
jgi:hypothetical protein